MYLPYRDVLTLVVGPGWLYTKMDSVRDIWAPPFGRDHFGAWMFKRWDVLAPEVLALCCFSAVSISLSYLDNMPSAT